MQRLRATIDEAARRDAKVLITGESGVGKDVAARRVHARSQWRARAFVAVNCAVLSEALLESVAPRGCQSTKVGARGVRAET